jgi:hypothetical protein
MLDVLYIARRLAPETLGGAEISMQLLLAELERQGRSVAVRQWPGGDIRSLEALLDSVASRWVFTQSEAAPSVALAARARRRRVAVFIRSLSDLMEEPREAREAMLRAADAVVCNSRYTAEVIRCRFPDSAAKVRVQYPTLPPPGDCLTLVRPSERKGLRVFRDLAAMLPARRFLVVDGEPLDPPAEHVVYQPETIEMGAVYRATRILLQPAFETEAFGRTVIEAASYGVPSVVSRQGGLPEALGPGGRTVERFDDADAWVEAIDAVEADYVRYALRAWLHARTFRSVDATESLLRADGPEGMAP